MTKAERAALRALEAKATPGQLTAIEGFAGVADIVADVPSAFGPRSWIASTVSKNVGAEQSLVNAHLLAAARNSIIALLDALDDAEAVIGAAQAMFLCGGADHATAFAVALDAYAAKHGGK